MMSTRLSNHVATTGFAGAAVGESIMHWAWTICMISMMIGLGFALLRFLPRFEK
jgi:hypothetical protein